MIPASSSMSIASTTVRTSHNHSITPSYSIPSLPFPTSLQNCGILQSGGISPHISTTPKHNRVKPKAQNPPNASPLASIESERPYLCSFSTYWLHLISSLRGWFAPFPFSPMCLSFHPILLPHYAQWDSISLHPCNIFFIGLFENLMFRLEYSTPESGDILSSLI